MVDSASPPPGVDLTDNRGPEIIAVTVGTWAIAVVFAALRVVSRKVKRNSLWIDDWLIMVSLVGLPYWRVKNAQEMMANTGA